MPQYTPEYDKHATSILTDVINDKSVNEVRQVMLDEHINVNRVYKVSEARGCNFTYFYEPKVNNKGGSRDRPWGGVG